MSLEDEFWKGLQEIAKQRANLSSAIRLYVLEFYRDQYKAGATLDPSIRQSPTVSHSTISRL